VLDEWVDTRNDIKLQIVFSTQNNETDKKTKVASHLISLQTAHDDVYIKKALHDWYEQKQKNYKDWAQSYPKKATNKVISEILEAQKEWCKLTEIAGTPTLFINGRRLPKTYQTEDLKYFI
jgi:hypothetical protein